MKDVWLSRCVLVLSGMVLAAALGRGPVQSGGALLPRETERGGIVSRDEARREEMARLTALAGDADVPQRVREAAGERLMELAVRTEQEKIIEEVLAGRGWPGAAATVQAGSVNVIVEGMPSEAEAGVMMELAARETGIAAENIRLIPAGRLDGGGA